MEFTEQIAAYIQKYAPQYGIRVCSPILAQAVLESACGTSELAVKAKNYFGLKYRPGRCPTACGTYRKTGSEQNPDGSLTSSPMLWMKFPDMESGVRGYFDFISIPAYANLKGVTDPETYLEYIKKDGYATSLDYVPDLMNVIRKYNLTKYDSEKEGSIPMNPIIQKLPANPSNYGGPRSASSIRYLVFHYTANRTDTARANASYFRNNVVKASAHYFVDRHDIYRSVEDLRIAYSVGGAKWSDCGATKGGSMYGKITNANSISIEMCSVGGAIAEDTLENAVSLGRKLMEKYHIPISHVYRHFDVNGKHCPGWEGWYGPDSPKWTDLKQRLEKAVQPLDSPDRPGTSGTIGSAPGGSSPGTIGSAPGNSSSSGANGSAPGGSSSGTCGPAPGNSSPAPAPYQVRLLDNLNIRKTPGGAVSQPGGAKKGFIYTIVETQGSWGRLKSGAGWISVSERYVSKVQK